MKPFRLSRRTMLRGAGGVAIGLPFLEAMRPTRNAYAAGPQRLVVFFTPNGTIYDNWKPGGSTGTNFTFSRILKPLEPMKEKLVLLEGLYQGAPGGKIGGPGDDHMKGMGWALTGRQLAPGSIPGGGGAPPAGLATGISVDQAIANQIGKTTKFKSLEFGVRSLTVAGNPLFHMVYTGPGSAIQPEQNPAKMFDRVFTNFTPGASSPTGPDPAALRRAEDKKSILDAVKDSYTKLSARAGAEDRDKLDAHLTHIKDIESRLTTTPGAGVNGVGGASAGCSKPMRPRDLDAYSEANFVENGNAQLDLMHMALTCDLTRVASIQWSYSSGGPAHRWIQMGRGHHDISHDGDGNATAREELTKVDIWYAEKFLALLKKMDSVDEGGTTMLDNSLVIWVNELAKGNTHSHGPMCHVIAGKAGGKLQTGRYVHAADKHNNLLVSLMNLMGVEATTFGDPSACTGALKGLTA